MKKQLDEVKKLQKLAGIIGEGHYRSLSRYYDEPVPFPQNGMGPDPGEPEYVDPAQEAQNIYDDLRGERGEMELMMSPQKALETVETYGYTGELAQDIAGYLMDLIG